MRFRAPPPTLTFLHSHTDLCSLFRPENPLIRGLKDLHESMISARDLEHVDTCAYVAPFLDVIVCEDIDATVTRITLQSVHKFLAYGYIHKESPNVEAAMDLVRRTRARFCNALHADGLNIFPALRNRLSEPSPDACRECLVLRRTRRKTTRMIFIRTARRSGPWRMKSQD
jgi:hypothetical protein